MKIFDFNVNTEKFLFLGVQKDALLRKLEQARSKGDKNREKKITYDLRQTEKGIQRIISKIGG